MMKKRMTLYMCKVEYLRENGFERHISSVNYWYRVVYNCRRGKSATKRLKEYKAKEHTND